MLELKLYLFTWAIAMVAFVYSEVLTDSGMILFHWRLLLFKIFRDEDNWLFKILVGCAMCIGGQWSLWSYLYIVFIGTDFFDKVDYCVWTHIGFVAITIFNVVLIKKAGLYGND